MQYCTDCKIHISTRTNQCPLCHKSLPDTLDYDVTQTYPDFIPLNKKKSRFVKVVSLTASVLILSSVLVNWLNWRGKLWCVIFSAHVLYIWLLGLLTFKKSVHSGLKLMTHAIAMTLLLVIINMFPYNTETISRVSWAVSYTMPVIIIFFIITIDVIIILKKKQNLRNYLLYQFSLCIIGFIPLILVLCGVAQPIYPGIIAAVCSYLTIIGLFIFEKKIVISEFKRKFHI